MAKRFQFADQLQLSGGNYVEGQWKTASRCVRKQGCCDIVFPWHSMPVRSDTMAV